MVSRGSRHTPGKTSDLAENRTMKLNPQIALSPKAEPRPHSWKASALNTVPTLLS